LAPKIGYFADSGGSASQWGLFREFWNLGCGVVCGDGECLIIDGRWQRSDCMPMSQCRLGSFYPKCKGMKNAVPFGLRMGIRGTGGVKYRG